MREVRPLNKANYATDYDQGLRSYMTAVFGHMSIGLFLTFLTSYFISTSDTMLHMLFGNPLMRMVIMFAPLILVFYFSMRLHKLAYETAQAIFYIYAFLVGLSISTIFIIYTHESIAQTFLIASVMFGSMSLYGYTTQRDLTKFGTFLMMGLIGLIVTMLVNTFFIKSTGLQMAVSVIGVLLFTGLTAYDVQVIKAVYDEYDDVENTRKKSLFGALKLYLDFLNLFLFILQFMGDRRR